MQFLSRRQREAATGWMLAAPAIILFVMFLIIPFIMAFIFSFTNQRLASPNPTRYVGFENYSSLLGLATFTLEPEVDPNTGEFLRDEDGEYVYPRLRNYTRNNPDYPHLNGMQAWQTLQIGSTQYILLARDKVFMQALLNTIIFAIVIAPGQGGFALLLAIMLNQKLRGINVFRTIYFMPVVVSMVVVSLLWRFIYDGNNGLLNTMLEMGTFGYFEPVDWLGTKRTALPAVIVMSIWQAVGFHMVIWLAGLQTIPAVLYEASEIDGASRWQQFRFVTWPGLRNTAIFVLVVITMQAFGLFTQIAVMTNGGPLDATQSIVFQAVERGYGKNNIAGGSAISVILFLLVLSVTFVQSILTRERRRA